MLEDPIGHKVCASYSDLSKVRTPNVSSSSHLKSECLAQPKLLLLGHSL